MKRAWLRDLRVAVHKYSIHLGQEYQLASGTKSRSYCDLKKTILRSDCKDIVTRALKETIPWNLEPQAFAGVVLGGCHLASLAGIAFDRDVIHVRKAPKDHGTKSRIEAPDYANGCRVILLEDVITTGASARDAVAALREGGFDVVAVVAVVNRELSPTYVPGMKSPHFEFDANTPVFFCTHFHDCAVSPGADPDGVFR